MTTDLAALHEALDAGARAAFAASFGDTEGTVLALKNASASAELAFTAGSPEAGGLATVLDAIGAAASEPACAGAPDPDLWFRSGSEDEAKAVCATCPVRPECLQDALDRKETSGIWGGLDPSERELLVDYGKTLTCGHCGRIKPVAEFGSDGKGGRRGDCLECSAAAKREQRKRRKENRAASAASGTAPGETKEKTSDHC